MPWLAAMNIAYLKITHATVPIRWYTVNVAYVNFLRNALQVTNQGPNPPAVLYLSDGGHIENLGILPLLKLRLPKIVSVEGGRTILDEDYAGSLLIALDMARKKLGCSFTGMDGRDITEDIQVNFVERSPGSQPRSYRSVTSYGHFHLFWQMCTWRARRQNVWLEVRACDPNAARSVRHDRDKCFSVKPDLTQSMSTLSYRHFRPYFIGKFRKNPDEYSTNV